MEKYQTFTKNQYFRLLIWRVAGALKKKKKNESTTRGSCLVQGGKRLISTNNFPFSGLHPKLEPISHH